jgi:hypothetical protein
VNEPNGKPLSASVVTGVAFVMMAAVMVWAGYVIRGRTDNNARVLCDVVSLSRQATVENLAVTPGTADDLNDELDRINEVYDRIASPIRNCDVRQNVPRP